MGTRIVADRYELIDEVGRGGMATVWRARDRRLQRIVALKLPRPELLDDVMIRRVEREARLAAGISHPNVVTVYDSGIVDGEPYVVMELLEGRTLSDMMGSLDPVASRKAAAELADGLSAIHAAGVVHRDIKPGNIVVSDSGPKLTDFGIARRADTDRLTQPHQVMGTPLYVAPEVLNGADAGPSADVYSLGVVVGEMITGRRHEGSSSAVRTGDPALDDLLARTTSDDRAARPTAAEFAAALRRGALLTLPIPAGVPEADTQPILAQGDSETTQQLGVAPVVAPPDDRHGRRRWAVLAVAAVVIVASLAFGLSLAGRNAEAADTSVAAITSTTTAAPTTAVAPTVLTPSTTAATTTTSTASATTTESPAFVSTPEQAASDLVSWVLRRRPNDLKPKDRRELLSEVDKVLESHQEGDEGKVRKSLEKLLSIIDDLDDPEGLALLAVLAESVGFRLDAEE